MGAAALFVYIFCTDQLGDTNCRRRVRPFRAAAFFQHRLSGGLEPRMRFTLSGRLLSLHQLSGGRELPQASSPYPGGSFLCTG